MLSVQGITSHIGARPVLHGVSAQFQAGQLTGLLGPNGAGKSTLLRTMADVLTAAQGTVLLDGKPLAAFSARQKAQYLAYIPQGQEQVPPMSVREVVSLGRLPYRESTEGAAHHPAVTEALALTGLTELSDRKADQLSGGEHARLMLARALATQAPVLLADEVLAALDPAHALSVMHLFRAVAAQGRCIVLVIHDLLLATRFCDRLLVLQNGQVQLDGPPVALTQGMVQHVYGVSTRWIEGACVPWDIQPA
ncbi:ABC transporter [Acetobacter cibinongensis]|uniref:ABC transporter n=1 Tax=Acetobacter cibinongensis TaxID=146475 RepID=A0A0D6N0S3_9PROT|nr:ABC transporter ATP-binding protein [Acetobacter cibinongensis]GAN59612.1 ABC transporter ferrichrome transport [Acetobacter cibinongensis]GEL59135.1 ABC transporter [Acetobacter cibinongensis]